MMNPLGFTIKKAVRHKATGTSTATSAVSHGCAVRIRQVTGMVLLSSEEYLLPGAIPEEKRTYHLWDAKPESMRAKKEFALIP